MDFHGHQQRTPAARQVLREYEAEQGRESGAIQRVREKRARGVEAWKVEVDKYGKDEALHRLREERELAKEMDQLTTSQAEQMDWEEQIADPALRIQAFFRISKRREWSKTVSECRMNDFSISDLEAEFWEVFDKAGGSYKGGRMSRIMVVIKITTAKQHECSRR